jgi:TolB-like protein/Tfp pilus assembly protein PilF
VVIAAVIGFPFAMLFSWFYEWTPQGIKRESEVVHSESITRQTGKKLDKAIIAVLALAVLVLLLNQFVLHRFMPGATTAAGDDKSIAVLPFENLSDDKANAYFATGIQDEILTRLAKIGALKVISRTSTQHFASSPDNLPEIAAKLGVAAILEGSVQRAGEIVHVNVQLIRAATDEHLWAESYNRKLDDIFAVQGEIAQTVADALSAKLTGAEKQQLAQKPTSNTQAYEAYLRALVYEGRYVNSLNEFQAWAGAYEDAVRLDPDFAQAWTGLSRVYTEWYFNVDTTPQRLALAKSALDQALRLAPDAPETWQALGLYRYWGLGDYDAAFAAYGEGLKRKPNASSILSSMGAVRRRQGYWEEALAFQQRAAVLDPLNSLIQFNLTLTYRALRRFDEAQRVVASGLVANPGEPGLLGEQLYTEQARGDLDAAHRFAEQVPLTASDSDVLSSRFEQWIFERDYARAAAEIGQVLEGRTRLGSSGRAHLIATLGAAEIFAGKSAEGLQHVSEARQLIEAQRATGNTNPYDCIELAQMSAVAGDHEAAELYALLAEAGLAKDAVGLPQAFMAHAVVELQVGDKAEAIALLEKAQSAPMPYGAFPAILRLDPQFDALRGDPAFEKLTVDPAPAAKPSTP